MPYYLRFAHCIALFLLSGLVNTSYAKPALLWHNAQGAISTYTFQSPTDFAISSFDLHTSAWQLASQADVNGDGQTDLIWRHQSSGLNYIHLLDQGVRKNTLRLNQVSDLNWQIAASLDMNGDGFDDLLWRHKTTGLVYAYLIKDSKILQHGLIQPLSLDWQLAASADFDKDGKDDLLYRNQKTGHNVIQLLNGLHIKSHIPLNQVKNQAWTIAATDDFDGDGFADLWWRHQLDGNNILYKMHGTHIEHIHTINTVPAVWQLEASLDLDQDKQADVIWRNRQTGENYLYLMQGAQIKAQQPLNRVADQAWQIRAGISMSELETNAPPLAQGLLQVQDQTLEISWKPQPEAESYSIYWSQGSSFDLTHAHKIENVSSPYHLPIDNSQEYRVQIVAHIKQLPQPISDILAIHPKTDNATRLKRDYYQADKFAHLSVLDTQGTRQYQLSTEIPLRDNLAPTRTVNEDTQQMFIRTGHPFFDALFAMALEETQQNITDTLSDANFLPSPCHCFATGAKWPYVWTRDTAYSTHLALAQLNPQIALNSLQFKLSPVRNQGDNTLEIVQDTGTGGSWPVSTDRVVWAIGADEVLKQLPFAQSFAEQAYQAMRNTIERDRQVIYDPQDGLYRGEQSFLDWRKQSYPSWTGDDIKPFSGNGTVHIGMSKALSTNVTHFAILQLTANMAEQRGDDTLQSRYQQWANALKLAINQQFWQDDVGLYSSLKTTQLAPAASYKYDLLGESLAILWGIASPSQAQRIVASYPLTAAGGPVIWPQQPDTVVYHNRAIWPFVSAYALQAAKQVGNASVVDRHMQSLILGSALNLSNMENFEYLQLNAGLIDEQPDTPHFNSQRQLWSVAAYINMVTDVLFGKQVTHQGLTFHPMLTQTMLQNWFTQRSQLSLFNLNYQGHLLQIHLHLPAEPAPNADYYQGAKWQLNGEWIDGQNPINASKLQSTNELHIFLESVSSEHSLTEAPSDPAQHLAPTEPIFKEGDLQIEGSDVIITFAAPPNGHQVTVYRNGQAVHQQLDATPWRDSQILSASSTTPCYSLEYQNLTTKLHSHHSEPACAWEDGRIQVLSQESGELLSLDGASTSSEHNRGHFNNWGDPLQQLEAHITPNSTGTYYVSVVYGNHYNEINTGITAAVKQIDLIDESTGNTVTSQIVFMPHLDDWSVWGESNFAVFTLSAQTHYTLRIRDFFNMSDLQHFENYLGGGGQEGRVNKANMAWLKVLRMQ